VPETLVESFRDPAGVTRVDERGVTRIVRSDSAPFALEFLKSSLARTLVDRRDLVRTWVVMKHSAGSIELGHELVPFRSYPSEWPPEMLHDAGRLTIDLAEEALRDGYGLKDATPFNILFNGPNPIFIDFLSFEIRDKSDPLWRPYAQFVQSFLLPLLSYRLFRTPPHAVFMNDREGQSLSQFLSGMPLLHKLRPEVWKLATLPSLLAKFAESRGPKFYEPRVAQAGSAQFALKRLFRNLRLHLSKLRPVARKSQWSDYQWFDHAKAAQGTKTEFITECTADNKVLTVLDIGCNTGTYSLHLARRGARVVAIDSDEGVVGDLWSRARGICADVLPLVIDIARPTPSLGWRNKEESSFLERVKGQFNCVLMLGILHHLVVSERIPLPEVLDLAQTLTTDKLVVEYIPPDDPMFIELLRGREHLHRDFTLDAFIAAAQKRFFVASTRDVPNSGRKLFLLLK